MIVGDTQIVKDTNVKNVEDDLFVDLVNDDLKQRHDEQLQCADLAEHGPERY